jgi:hypothetical protein
MQLASLMKPLDPVEHAVALSKLTKINTLSELEDLARAGWLMPPSQKRLKLVRHGSGTFLVVSYEDGWSTRLSMVPFSR